MIIQKTIQEVMNTARIEDVVGDFVNLRRRGVNLIGNCPFHDEKTPSFTVNPAKNIYKCFGCGKGGDPVRFIIEHEKLSFPEAIRFLAQKYRIEVEETANTAEQIEQKLVTDSLYIVNEFARDYYMDVLLNRQEGRQIGMSYFKERGFLEGTIKKFQLGYATEAKDEFTIKAIDKKYNLDHLHALGLTSKTSQLDFFRSRVMFTIHNVSGKVIAFAGRTLSADKKIPKYINSPESEIYNKRNVLYGLYFAKEAIRKADECILVEGYTDVITLHQSGIENVVAASGTSLTKEQIRLIKRYTPNIKIIFDGDAAGVKAALRGLDMVLESDMNVKLVLLPDSQDPDSYLAQVGPQAFNEFLVEKQEDFVFFKTKLLLQEIGNDPIKKTAVIKDIVLSISKIPDTFKRALYIRQCASMLDLNESMFVSEVNKAIKADIKQKTFVNDGDSMPTVDEDEWLKTKIILSDTQQPTFVFNDAFLEKDVCRIIVNYSEKWMEEEPPLTIAQYIIDQTEELLEDFDVPLYKNMIEDAQNALNQGIALSHTYYTGHQNEEIRNFAVDVLSSPYTYANWDSKEIKLQTQKMPDENFQRDCLNAVLRLKLRKSKNTIQHLQEKLEKASPEERESEEYLIDLKVVQVLIEQRNEMAKQLRTVTL